MLDIAVISDATVAESSLDPTRSRLLAALREPGSATTLAVRLELPRQKVNYHLRELERHGLVELVEERRRGNMTERVMRATAMSYVISPEALDAVAPDPRRGVDQLSARWLLAVASRLVQDVGTLIGRAARARKPLATFTIDSELTFATPGARSAFAEELALTMSRLVTKYDTPGAAGGRPHRIILALHPSITEAGTAAALEPANAALDGGTAGES